MSTPTNRQAEKEAKPPTKQGQATPKGQANIPKRPPAASQPARAPQRATQGSSKPNQSSTRAANQPVANAATPTTSKAATPPPPKPRDLSVARRDERREERRAVMLARLQEQHRELQQAKRQKLSVRYGAIIAAILLVGLVSFFTVTRSYLDAIISGMVIIVAFIVLLAVMSFAPATKARTRRNITPPEPPGEEESDEQQPTGQRE